jgi:glutamyl-tRNA reductase
MDGFITIFVGILGAVTTLVGVTFANKHNAQQAQVTQYYKFIEQQVSEFYSPILALRAEIVAQSKLAPKLDKIMDEQLKERRPNPEYDDISEDLNRYYRAQFSKLLKSYEQILFVFRE